jgi:hypothetical protein
LKCEDFFGNFFPKSSLDHVAQEAFFLAKWLNFRHKKNHWLRIGLWTIFQMFSSFNQKQTLTLWSSLWQKLECMIIKQGVLESLKICQTNKCDLGILNDVSGVIRPGRQVQQIGNSTLEPLEVA